MGVVSIRVLVVDDLPQVRDALQTLLMTLSGIDVIGAAADGQEGLQLARDLRPDVVLMDLEMPGMNGYDATREIVTAELGRVVILSIHSHPALRAKAMAAGASAFIEKGAPPDELLQALLDVPPLTGRLRSGAD